MQTTTINKKNQICFHCGEGCKEEVLKVNDHSFCCNGCKTVYEILSQNNLCDYYNYNEHPGQKLNKPIDNGKFDILDEEEVQKKLISFKDNSQTQITFFLPSIHCSSCIWILENLEKIGPGIVNSRVDFLKKEVKIVFLEKKTSLKELAILLTTLGYEPYLSYENLNKATSPKLNRSHIYKIGIAGFCFGNIMMLSFPDYFASGMLDVPILKKYFNLISIVLALPVLFYCASEFFTSALAGFKQRILNIDAPIALAILITFFRSLFEILINSNAGYLDSMSGIVFFMLLGRYFQNITYDTLSFDRNYKSYFPISVNKLEFGKSIQVPLDKLNPGDTIVIHNNEIIPADGILKNGKAYIDYSFVTGESKLVEKIPSDLIYAGGKHVGKNIEIEVAKNVEQSYLTSLWNHASFKKENLNKGETYLDKLSKYFSMVVLVVSLVSFSYWMFIDVNKALNALTTPLIVACPCALLLAATFANGNGIRIFSRNKLYIKNNSVIDDLSRINAITFDKTGTLTNSNNKEIAYEGNYLTDEYKCIIKSLTVHSIHPLSKALANEFGNFEHLFVSDFCEMPGQGISARVNGSYIKLGSAQFTGQISLEDSVKTNVYFTINNIVIGKFIFCNKYRNGITNVLSDLSNDIEVYVLSGDNDGEKNYLNKFIPNSSNLLFNQMPQDKLNFIETLKETKNVLMIGDGLNDAGALKSSHVGIAVADNINNFSPSCDAIIEGEKLTKIKSFLLFSNDIKTVINYCFALSIIYNIVGLFYALQGILSPVIAAIIMPLSSITIVLFTTSATNYFAKKRGLD